MTQLVCVTDYPCEGTQRGRSREEAAAFHEIVFPRAGVFVRHDAWGSTVADVNTALFFNRGQPYQVSHPVGGGDHSTVFAVADDVLLDMFCDPRAFDRPDRPFQAGHTFIDARLRLVKILSADDALQHEEQILLFLGDVVRSQRSAPIDPKPAHRDLAEQTRLLLAARWRDKLCLRDIAAAVYASPYFLCRVFHAQTGLTLHQYVLRLRLLYALECLAEQPRQDLTALALDLGFSTHSQFTTAFRRHFGLPPSRLRRPV